MNNMTEKMADLKWLMSVEKKLYLQRFSFPVFKWSFGDGKIVGGGELLAWSIQGFFIFYPSTGRSLGEEGYIKFYSAEQVLDFLEEEYHYSGKPPHFDEVSNDLNETREKLSGDVYFDKAGQQILESLQKKWEKLVGL